MAELKIKDNSQVDKEYFKAVSNITEKITDKTLAQLAKEGVFVFPESLKDSPDISKNQMILQSVNHQYCASNVMGFLGYGNERFVIESRFSTGEYDFFFQYLLERVLDFPNILELNTNTNRDNRLFNLLLFLFPKYLQAAMRKGVFKTYIRNQYNDNNVKGAIDIARHIRANIPFVGNIAYNQREFSYDNYLMELIRHTIEFIKRKSYGNNLLRKAKDEVEAVIEVTNDYEYYDRRKIIIANKKSPISHAYYHEYRDLQRLCIMILQHEKHQIGYGIQQVNGILFDGAWLWEEYVNLLIGDTFYHPMNKGGKGAQHLFAGNVGLIYPDFIGKDKNNRIIADAKYKPIENIRNKDYLQVLSYMFRFDAKKGFYLYPESGEVENLELKLNSGSKYEDNVIPREDISVIKYGLHIPSDVVDYKDFVSQVKRSEVEFVSNLHSHEVGVVAL